MRNDSKLDSDQYRLILDSLAEGVCTVDRDWNITSFNRAAQELTGVSAAEALKLSFGDIFRCEVCECQAILSGVLEKGEAVRDVDTRIMNRSGERIPISLNAAPFRDARGRIDGVVAIFRDNRPLELLRKELRQEFTFGDIVSKNARMRRILDILPDVAESDSTVLVLGPSGTGKELVARAIHQASRRKSHPFIAVNCAALPDTLLESELFGYRRGAFTDAKRDKPGRFDRAEGGTLFLDEIGDISPALQVKLLRVLQERQYEPLGATMAVNANVRIVAATNRDLAALVGKEAFRSDLYYRLNVIQLDLPPLAERLEDIPLLVAHFIEKLNAEKGRGVKGISRAAMARLMRHPYPGNIRELENIIERAYVLCRKDEIQEECLPPNLTDCAAATSSSAPLPRIINLRMLPAAEERSLIVRTLRECNGNQKETAARLAISPVTLWRKMKKHELR